MKCQSHNHHGQCDEWNHASGPECCQTCGGCGFGCAQTDWGAGENPQDVLFNCVEFASVECSFDVSSCTGERCVTYGEALEAFGQCAQTGSTAGYCRGSLASAAFLRNQDVCEGPDGGPASNSNIGFRAPPYARAVSFYPSQNLGVLTRASCRQISACHSASTPRAITTSGFTLTTEAAPSSASTGPR